MKGSVKNWMLMIARADGGVLELLVPAKTPDDAMGRAADEGRMIKETERVIRCRDIGKIDPMAGAA